MVFIMSMVVKEGSTLFARPYVEIQFKIRMQPATPIFASNGIISMIPTATRSAIPILTLFSRAGNSSDSAALADAPIAADLVPTPSTMPSFDDWWFGCEPWELAHSGGADPQGPLHSTLGYDLHSRSGFVFESGNAAHAERRRCHHSYIEVDLFEHR
jgi:hypothetical protein